MDANRSVDSTPALDALPLLLALVALVMPAQGCGAGDGAHGELEPIRAQEQQAGQKPPSPSPALAEGAPPPSLVRSTPRPLDRMVRGGAYILPHPDGMDPQWVRQVSMAAARKAGMQLLSQQSTISLLSQRESFRMGIVCISGCPTQTRRTPPYQP